MPVDSDVALIGTGIAPLIAAHHLITQGKSVLLLNPDRDFFLEDSELPLDPLLLNPIPPLRLARSSPNEVILSLRPPFPGAIEFWNTQTDTEMSGFRDPAAPHVRQRDRLWISSLDENGIRDWDALENLFVDASDAGFNPKILEGIAAARRFPGSCINTGRFRGLLVPKICDVDVVRYQNGLQEYIRERLGSDRVICGTHSVEWMPEGVRFHANNSLNTARIKDGVLVFWTPRLTSWVMNQIKRHEIKPDLPRGIRLWEQWAIHSRENLDPTITGVFGDMVVWADFEGHPAPHSNLNRLSILKKGPLVGLEAMQNQQRGLNWASSESFNSLAKLFHSFLKWDRFSIRSLKTRAIFEWDQDESWLLTKSEPRMWIVPACDGPLFDVVRAASLACGQILK